MNQYENKVFITRLLDVIESDILPLTRASVSIGNKIFGAAILRKDDYSLVIAETNNEIQNPLWHGEVHTLKKFYELPAESRPCTKDCLFVSTHEPCSLCLSAITWSGFDNFFYLFGYDKTADIFNIPHDLRILEAVFHVKQGTYARNNRYWNSFSIPDLVASLDKGERKYIYERTVRLHNDYYSLSKTYQRGKVATDIPLP